MATILAKLHCTAARREDHISISLNCRVQQLEMGDLHSSRRNRSQNEKPFWSQLLTNQIASLINSVKETFYAGLLAFAKMTISVQPNYQKIY